MPQPNIIVEVRKPVVITAVRFFSCTRTKLWFEGSVARSVEEGQSLRPEAELPDPISKIVYGCSIAGLARLSKDSAEHQEFVIV
jgi:hypothetical protein